MGQGKRSHASLQHDQYLSSSNRATCFVHERAGRVSYGGAIESSREGQESTEDTMNNYGARSTVVSGKQRRNNVLRRGWKG